MPRGEHRSSLLLSREENEQVFSLIGPKCQSLATAVVQLFTTEGPGHCEWRKTDTGVLCLIKDNSKRSYFFRMYCLFRKIMIWEHEVYLQIEYKSPRPYLHTFEAEECMTAFNFANEDEARILRSVLLAKIELRKQKREERRKRSLQASRTGSVSHPHQPQPPERHNGAAPPVPAPTPPPPRAPVPGYPTNANINSNTNTLKATKKSKTRKLTKADIGAPQDFKHVSHVGWTPEKGFDVENLQEEAMRSFLSKAGISETQLQDPSTREFIYDFIQNNGGMDAVKDYLHNTDKPDRPLKSAAPPPAPPAAPAPLAPPVPSRAPAVPPAPPSRAPPPPPSRAVPPPPAPKNPPPPRPTQHVAAPPLAPPAVPPPPPPPAPPAPPPPPPAPVAPPLPGAPPPAASADPRAALMESIRSGNKTLRKVGVTAAEPVVEDSRSNLLSEIRQGKELRSVQQVSRSTSGSGADRRGGSPCGLASALARALDIRNNAMHCSDTESDSDSHPSDDEDWE